VRSAPRGSPLRKKAGCRSSSWARDDGGGIAARVLEHIVDTVLYFEGRGHPYRILKAVKNRSARRTSGASKRAEGLTESRPSGCSLRTVDENAGRSSSAIEGPGAAGEVQAPFAIVPRAAPNHAGVGLQPGILMRLLEKKAGVSSTPGRLRQRGGGSGSRTGGRSRLCCAVAEASRTGWFRRGRRVGEVGLGRSAPVPMPRCA